MATESLQTQLERVQTAIAAIESGSQAFSVLNKSFTKADLATLYARETQLKNAIARASRDGLRVQRVVPL